MIIAGVLLGIVLIIIGVVASENTGAPNHGSDLSPRVSPVATRSLAIVPNPTATYTVRERLWGTRTPEEKRDLEENRATATSVAATVEVVWETVVAGESESERLERLVSDFEFWAEDVNFVLDWINEGVWECEPSARASAQGIVDVLSKITSYASDLEPPNFESLEVFEKDIEEGKNHLDRLRDLCK